MPRRPRGRGFGPHPGRNDAARIRQIPDAPRIMRLIHRGMKLGFLSFGVERRHMQYKGGAG